MKFDDGLGAVQALPQSDVVPPNPLAIELANARRDNIRLRQRLDRAEAIIELQKNELGSDGRLWR